MFRFSFLAFSFVLFFCALSPATSFSAGTGIQMLPPVQSDAVESPCVYDPINKQGNKLLTWDGATAIKCNKDVTVESTGNVGIGTPTPLAKLDVRGNALVTGSVKVGNDTAACVPTKAGSIKWNGATMSYCDGAKWKSFSEPSNSVQCGEGTLMQWDPSTETSVCKPIYAATTCSRHKDYADGEAKTFTCPAGTRIVSGSCWRKERTGYSENWMGGLFIGDTVALDTNSYSCRIEGAAGVYVNVTCCK